MDSKSVLEYKKNILDKLSKRQLKEAFELLMKLVVNVQDWHISEKLSELETNYKYMLHYQFEGVNDPERDSIYNSLIRSLYEYTDDASDELLTVESSNVFYEKLRVNTIRKPLALGELRIQLRDVLESASLVNLLENGDTRRFQERDLSVRRERLDSELFNVIFVSARANEEIEKEYNEFLADESLSVREKCLFVSALSLSLFHRFDAKKVSVLMNACKNESSLIVARAIVGLIVVLQMYDVRWKLYPECKYQLDALSESEAFRKLAFSVIKQFIGSRETEKISRKMTEEIIPEMMKFSSLAGKKLNIQDLIGETDFADKNPEWKKELEDSGLANKLQEYSSLQMEGADVFHSTFANLKNFSFFRELNNWFLPFDISYSELQPLTSDRDDLSGLLKTAVLGSGHMCDSDKYSFAFSLLQIPSAQRQMMLSRFGEESEQIKELQKDALALNPKINDEIISNQYIQDLYRFFKLSSYKNNFFDIFKLRLNFYEKESIAPLISDPASMLKIANYCFDKNYFEEALTVYQKILASDSDKSDIWQRIGYCKQMLDDLEGALDAYLQAELLSPENSWIIKRIAQVYKSLKDPQRALEYYQHAGHLNPDNLGIELNIGHCYLELGDYEKALNSYFKIEVMETKTTKAWRPIAWTAFLLRKFDISRNYYKRILSDKPNMHDYLNAGHVEFCEGNMKAALDLYFASAQNSESFEQFERIFDEDRKELLLAGVDSSYLPLLFDELRYKLD